MSGGRWIVIPGGECVRCGGCSIVEGLSPGPICDDVTCHCKDLSTLPRWSQQAIDDAFEPSDSIASYQRRRDTAVVMPDYPDTHGHNEGTKHILLLAHLAGLIHQIEKAVSSHC